MRFSKKRGKVARLVVLVPVETAGHVQPLRRVEAERVDVLDVDEEGDQRLLAVLPMPNSCARLISLTRIAADAGEADFLRARICACSSSDEKPAR